MPACSIKGCKNTNVNCKNKCISFFSLPKNEEMKSKWLEYVRDPTNLKNARVCSIHFKTSCYKPKPTYLYEIEGYIPIKTRKLLDDAVPTEYLKGEVQPAMYGAKTEWIPSDGLNQPGNSRSNKLETFSTELNIASSDFLKDDFVIYNYKPVQGVSNQTTTNMESIAIEKRIYTRPKESKSTKEITIATTTVETDEETIFVYTHKNE